MKVRVTAANQLIALVAACAVLATPHPALAQWRHGHSDAANTSLARVDTLPAQVPTNTIPQIGPMAPYVNPVVGPDGSIYFGNMQGLIWFRDANANIKFTRQLSPEHGGIFSSGVVGADGSLYIVSTLPLANSLTRNNQSYLHKFSAGGAWIFTQPFPKSPFVSFSDGGVTNAHPTIWQWNGQEVIMVPVKYQGSSGEDISVVAFSSGGAFMGMKAVSFTPNIATGGSGIPFIDALLNDAATASCVFLTFATGIGCLILQAVTGGWTFSSPDVDIPLPGAGFPIPPVAIMPDPSGAPPRIVVTAREKQKVILGFFPGTGFSELRRISNPRHNFIAGPVMQPNGVAVTGTVEGVLTGTRTDFTEAPAVALARVLTASPTLHKDGSLVVVSRAGDVIKRGSGTFSHRPGGASVVSAASSCTHVFVSTSDNFYTYDARNMQLVATMPWTGSGPGGGLSAPVIGKGGRVYVIGNNNLYFFRGSTTPWGDDQAGTACDTFAPVR